MDEKGDVLELAPDRSGIRAAEREVDPEIELIDDSIL
jgi:hypothetical protein